MDVDAILARAARAREFTAQAGGWSFTLRLPTPYEEQRAAVRAGDGPDALMEMARLVLEQAVVGWSGPTVGDVVGEPDAAPLPVAPGTVSALLAGKPDVFQALAKAYRDERLRRQAALEGDAKN